MTRKTIQILTVALLTIAPFALAQAGTPELEEPNQAPAAEMSLPGMFVECAGMEYTDASQGVPDCIVKVVTANLQQRIELDAARYLQVKVQDQQRRLLAGDAPAEDVKTAAAGDHAEPTS